MIGLLVDNACRPPSRLGLFWVVGLGNTADHSTSVIWVMNLLPWLDELDVGLGNGTAVELLEFLKGLLVVPS